MAVHVDHGDGLVAALLPVVDERLGARRPLLRRALRRQLDDLCRQDALAGRAARDAGGLADAPGVRQHGLLVARAGLDIGLVLVLVLRVLALAQNVLRGLPRGRRAAAFDGREPGVKRPHDPLGAVVSEHPPLPGDSRRRGAVSQS